MNLFLGEGKLFSLDILMWPGLWSGIFFGRGAPNVLTWLWGEDDSRIGELLRFMEVIEDMEEEGVAVSLRAM